MESLLIYILKSSLLLALLTSIFTALMQQETFHRLNRFVLLATTAFSLVLPAVNLGIENPIGRLFAQEEKTSIESYGTIEFTDSYTVTSELTEVQEPAKEIDWSSIITVIYILGVVLSITRQITMYASLCKIIRESKEETSHPYTTQRIHLHVTEDENIKPFSWFNQVVINHNDLIESGNEIITHETAHARSLHSADILFIDLVIIMQWFNPMAWFVKTCMKNIHEFEADETVINSGVNIEKYQRLIIKKAVGARLYSIANSFNHSSTFKRITMMCKKKSNPWRCTKALYIIPVATIATLLFSQPESANAVEPQSNGEVTNLISNKQSSIPIIEISALDTPIEDKRDNVNMSQPQTDDTKNRVYQIVEKKPQYPGGEAEMMKYLMKNIKYPSDARKANIEGRCFVSFVVTDKGAITDVSIAKSTGNEALDQEAMRVVANMPAWIPGKQGGKAVNTKLTLPINFKLQGGEKQPQENTKTYNFTTPVYQVVEEKPQYPGGEAEMMKYLMKNINYPSDARKANIEGRCFVSFVVTDKGAITDVSIAKSTGNEALDQEAMRVVANMPAWIPGKQGGKAVNTKFTLPVAFKLQNGASKVITPALDLTATNSEEPLTLNADSPLLVINGTIYDGDAGIISNFRDGDVEDITVIKSVEATKIYGEKGEHGAIQINLKKRTSFNKSAFNEEKKGNADTKFTRENASGKHEIELKNAIHVFNKESEIPNDRNNRKAVFTGSMPSLIFTDCTGIDASRLTQGKARIKAVVETNRTLTSLQIIESSGNDLWDHAAIISLNDTQGQWEPAIKQGKPVPSTIEVSFSFSMPK